VGFDEEGEETKSEEKFVLPSAQPKLLTFILSLLAKKTTTKRQMYP
jgi:hypothetical protein